MKQNQKDNKLLLKKYTRREFLLHGLSFLKNFFLFQMMFSNVFSRVPLNLLKSEIFLSQESSDIDTRNDNDDFMSFFETIKSFNSKKIYTSKDYSDNIYIYKNKEYKLQKITSCISPQIAMEEIFLDIFQDPDHYFHNFPSEEYLKKYSDIIILIFNNLFENKDFSDDFKEKLSIMIQNNEIDERFLYLKKTSNIAMSISLFSNSKKLDNTPLKKVTNKKINFLRNNKLIVVLLITLFLALYYNTPFFYSMIISYNIKSSYDNLEYSYVDAIDESDENNNTITISNDTGELLVSNTTTTIVRYVATISSSNSWKNILVYSYIENDLFKMSLLNISEEIINENTSYFSILNLYQEKIFSSNDYITYNFVTHFFTLYLSDKDLDFLLTMNSLIATAISTSLVLLRIIPKAAESRITSVISWVLAAFFYHEKVNYGHFNISADVSGLANKNFSNYKEIAHYFFLNKITFYVNDKNYTILVPVTLAYTYYLESTILNKLKSIYTLISNKIKKKGEL